MAGEGPDTQPLTAGEILREIHTKLGLSHEYLATQIPYSASAIGHWETGRTVPKRAYLVDFIRFCIGHETAKIIRKPSYQRFVTRKKANQLLKAFQYSDIESADIGEETWTAWIMSVENNMEYGSRIALELEGLNGVDPATKAKIIQEIERILKKLDE
jgi:hypothetical protein